MLALVFVHVCRVCLRVVLCYYPFSVDEQLDQRMVGELHSTAGHLPAECVCELLLPL